MAYPQWRGGHNAARIPHSLLRGPTHACPPQAEMPGWSAPVSADTGWLRRVLLVGHSSRTVSAKPEARTAPAGASPISSRRVGQECRRMSFLLQRGEEALGDGVDWGHLRQP